MPIRFHSFDDVDHELLAIAWELIRTYRIDRRPAAIVANSSSTSARATWRGVLAHRPGSCGHMGVDRLVRGEGCDRPAGLGQASSGYEEIVVASIDRLETRVGSAPASRLTRAVPRRGQDARGRHRVGNFGVRLAGGSIRRHRQPTLT